MPAVRGCGQARRVRSAGAARWLVLSGPPGIGKTRLAEEITGLVAEGGGDDEAGAEDPAPTTTGGRQLPQLELAGRGGALEALALLPGVAVLASDAWLERLRAWTEAGEA
mgnify:CR=1 FL=1